LLRCTLLAGSLLVAACGGDADEADEALPADDPAVTVGGAGDDVAAEGPVDTDTTTTLAADTTTTTSLGPPALDDTSKVSTVGLDTVTFGMSLEAAQVAAGTVFVPEGPVARCTVYRPEQGPQDVRFTVVDGTVERVDVLAGPIRTRSGIGVGSPVADVYARFGAQAQPAPRDDGTGEDIVFVPQDEADAVFRVVFETDGAVVTRYRSGRIPVVLPSAACATVQFPPAAPSS
jgi:hypothetical protein